MLSTFWTYLQLGFAHITDLGGYDHILFLVALCAAYTLADWRRVLLLVTAFTLGHSLTLLAAALAWVGLNQPWVEFLIPVTIVLTALGHLLPWAEMREGRKGYALAAYLMALLFGLVHGLGFSNFFRSVLFPGEEGQLIGQLLAFNLGVELGQLLIVVLILGVGTLLLRLGLPRRNWQLFLAGAAFGLALQLALERWPL